MHKQVQILVNVVTDGTANCVVDLSRDPVQPTLNNGKELVNWLHTYPVSATASISNTPNGSYQGPVASASVYGPFLTVTLTSAQANGIPAGSQFDLNATLDFA